MDIQKKTEINECLISIKDGDDKAVARLYVLIAHSLRHIALKYLVEIEDVFDLEQDFWADIYKIAAGFIYTKNAFSYLSKVMTRMALNRYKKINGEKRHNVEPLEYNVGDGFDEFEVVAALDDKIAVWQALDKLDPILQKIIKLYIFEEKTLVQIAKEINMTKSQVGRFKKDAEEKLKLELEEYKQNRHKV